MSQTMTEQMSCKQVLDDIVNVLGVQKMLLKQFKYSYKDQATLLQERKLALLVDLDQTLIHTTNEEFAGPQVEGMLQFTCKGTSHLTMLRPHHKRFLESMSNHFEMHVVTLGVRDYAKVILQELDPEGRFFGRRILTRENIPNSDKFAAMQKLFPGGHEHVLAIDDKVDVWKHMDNLHQVPEFTYFKSKNYGLKRTLIGSSKNDDALLEAEKILLHAHEKFFDYYERSELQPTSRLFKEVQKEWETVRISEQIEKLFLTVEKISQGQKVSKPRKRTQRKR
ncbi:hypothetical protein L596_009173 [Steinernema carpocapsae]|uniref:protein-serine/threonine phosphatase n=1 Tax=Steinernema carpocapsae TaxID=34508 RepID=A0A4U5PEK7_STECR|nr:hypothetical protein L596_009173 [Steinernema carpocapsae]